METSSSPFYIGIFFFRIWDMNLGKSDWRSVNELLQLGSYNPQTEE